MNKTNQSWRHHYIPQFYLKGFVNQFGTFSVYDKYSKTLKKGEYYPKSHFYENKRNTVTINGSDDDFIETEMYKMLDDDISKVFKIIQETKSNFLNDNTLFPIKAFIAFLYWRLPQNDNLIEKIIDTIDFTKLGFDIIEKDSRKSAPEEIKQKFKTNAAFRKAYRFILPFSTFNIGYQKKDELKWRSVFYEKQGLHLTSDYPVILKKADNPEDKDQALIMPLTSNKVIFYGNYFDHLQLPPEFHIKLDLGIFHLANQYVCCPSKDYLNTIANLYTWYSAANKTDIIVNEIFDYLK